MRSRDGRDIGRFLALALLGCAGALAAAPKAEPAPAAPVPNTSRPEPALKTFAQPIPTAAYTIEMVPIPGDPAKGIRPFWMSKTEVTWDAFDVFAYRLDEPEEKREGVDATTRPTKPYLPPDRGFGHEGFAAICVSHKNAAAFCAWLSGKSGRTFRLATEDEWEHAARGGAPSVTKPDAVPPASLDLASVAWFEKNAEGSPHKVASKRSNAFGLFDMLGNVREWVNGRDGTPVVKGGSYLDPAEKCTVEAREKQDKSWNASDPQVPKSAWWLADGPFIGFRIVCEMPPDPDDADPSKPRPKEGPKR